MTVLDGWQYWMDNSTRLQNVSNTKHQERIVRVKGSGIEVW